MSDYFRSPAFFWWIIILPALAINFLAYYSPLTLSSLPFIGPLVAHIGVYYHWITIITNLIALTAHLGEGLYAFYLCRMLKFSMLCSVKWFVQTFALGSPSLIIIGNFAKKHKK